MKTSFFEKVYQLTQQIPEGRVSTYGAIARCIGSPGAARMVGWALNKCHTHPTYVPAHRVVNRNGLLSGKRYFSGENTMAELLASEGIEIADSQILNFDKVLWQPCPEL